MSWLALIALAFGLAMDAMAVALARGAASDRLTVRSISSVAALFGGFHAMMPAVGGAAGATLAAGLGTWFEWVASAVLLAVGVKMLLDPLRRKPGCIATSKQAAHRLRGDVALALATSLDALPAGISLSLLQMPLALCCMVIGGVAALVSALGFALGHLVGECLGRYSSLAGGLVRSPRRRPSCQRHCRAGHRAKGDG